MFGVSIVQAQNPTPTEDAIKICECLETALSKSGQEIMTEMDKCETLSKESNTKYENDAKALEEWNKAGEKCVEDKKLEEKMAEKMDEMLAAGEPNSKKTPTIPSTGSPVKDALAACDCMEKGLNKTGEEWLAEMEKCAEQAEAWGKLYEKDAKALEEWNKAGEKCVEERKLEEKMKEKMK